MPPLPHSPPVAPGTVRRILAIGRLWVLLLGLLPYRGFAEPPAPPTPEILIINSYAPGYEWSDDELAGLLRTLRTRYSDIEPVIQHLDFKRFPNPAREVHLLEDLKSKCHERPPSLVVTLDDFAFEFALRHRATIGADIPLVFGGLNRFTPDLLAERTNITGVSEESDFSGTFRLIASLVPKAKRILVIGNQTPSSIGKRMSLEAVLPLYRERYEFGFFEDWTNEQLFDRLATLPADTVGLILDVTRDSAGTYNYNNSAFSKTLATRASVPVFITARPPGPSDWSVEPWDGIGGGLVVADLHGATVGQLALRVLAGERADAIPVVRHSPERLEVNYPQLRRYGLSLRDLPPGTSVVNAPVDFYRIYRGHLIVAASVFVALCAIIVALLVTIVQRRRAERTLRQTEEKLRSAQKMEAVGRLAGGIAHDFNNILQVVQSHAAFLQETTTLTGEQREDVEMVLGAAQRAAQLTRQLLVFSRRQALNPEPLDPNELITEFARMLRRVLGEHIALVTVPLANPVILVADKGQIEQVLLNLCLNARDAMPGGGRIEISLETVEVAPEDCGPKSELKPGPHLLLKVSDNGCGMPRAVLDRIFEPFFTTKEAGQGTGLGLSVVYGIVRQHFGAISVYSEVGSGTVFRITLPLSAEEQPVAPKAAPPPIPTGHGAILLAEDDPAVRAIAVRILAANGFEVVVAADGEEAIALAERHAARLRLAILDVLMPKRTGREVHDFLRQRLPALPVLFCSGYTAEMLPPGAMPVAGVALLNKPYPAQELLATVHRLLGTARA